MLLASQWRFCSKVGVNSILSNQFGIPKSWITPDELYGATLCWFSFSKKHVPSYFFFVVKLQKCFMNYETLPNFLSAWREGEHVMTEFSFSGERLLLYVCRWFSRQNIWQPIVSWLRLIAIQVAVSSCGSGSPVWDGGPWFLDSWRDIKHMYTVRAKTLQRACRPHHKRP